MSTTAQRRRRKFIDMATEHAELIGRRIRQARAEKGLTQTELAARIPGKADGSQLSKWERGQHRVGDDTLRHIARILEKEVGWFHADPSGRSRTSDPFLRDEETQLGRVEAKLDRVLFALDAATEEEARQVREALARLEAAAASSIRPAPGRSGIPPAGGKPQSS